MTREAEEKAFEEWAATTRKISDNVWLDCWRAACRWRAQRDAEIANAHCVSEVCSAEDHGHDEVACGQWIKKDAGL